MGNSDPTIRCKKCREVFEPDVKSRRVWVCPSCHAKNPNLKRHYRSVADLCILGFIATAIFLIVGLKTRGINTTMVLASAHAVLLLVTIIWVYRSKAPWKDRVVTILIWTVFGVAFVANTVVFLLVNQMLFVSMLPVYAVVFSYLAWLKLQSNKCMVS